MSEYTADELRSMAVELATEAEQPKVQSMLHAGADAMEKRDELLVGNREISVKLIAQRSREFILEKAINQARAWYTEDSDLHEKQGRTVKFEICLERANWLNRQLEVLPPSGEDALAKAEAAQERVKELEDAARDYMAHTNSGMYRDKTGMRPEPSPQYERLFNLLHTEARAALQVKPKPDAPGIGWKLSDEAKKDIAEIERHAKFYR